MKFEYTCTIDTMFCRMTKDRIEKLIAKGELKTALDELLAWTKGKVELVEVYNLLLSNAGRLADLERNKQGGELDHEKAAQLESQIRNAVVGILGQVPASVWEPSAAHALSSFNQLRTDPLLLNFVKIHGDAYDHDPVLFTDFWEEVKEKYGPVRERDLLAILEDVHQALVEIPQLAARFVTQHGGKWRTTQWVDFKDGIEEKYETVMSVKELAALVEEKKRGFEEMLKDFVWIEGGEFMMGAIEGDEKAQENEKPRHKVRLTGFYMGKYTVMVGQFAEFVRATKYQPAGVDWQYDVARKPQTDQRHPIIWVSWHDAISFCNYWNQKYGFSPTYDRHGNLLTVDGKPTNQLSHVIGFRLPSETEWEYACRAGTSTLFYTGGSLLKEQANFGRHVGRTQPVGTYPPNPWGLYDMAGNVYEWCQDVYDGQFYTECHNQGIAENSLKLDNRTLARVLRGGSWSDNFGHCRPSCRLYFHPDGRPSNVGFRLVLFLPPHS